ncbi:MAG TPA: pyridoxal phosphate-dependent aminotransferase [Candidatus Acidoferrales bacterium]|nr:pyridoxal phosphate-dependent aminotransferase [Candidatus Acidoferrales bacterium]
MFADRANWDLRPNRLSKALAAHRAAAKTLLDLTVSNPTECGFGYEEDEIRRALASPSVLRYQPDPRGMRAARMAVANYYSDRETPVQIQDIFLTTSTSEAYSFAFRVLCNQADEVLIPAPSYPLFDYLADIHDVKVRRYPLLYDHGWQIDFHALEKLIDARTRAVIVVNPNNPTGHFTKTQEAAELNEMCVTHDMALIVDEVFLDFALENNEARRSLATNSRALTFTASGLSKISGLPQMKAAWLVVNGPLELKAQALARLEVIADTYLSMNAPVQSAMPTFLKQRHKFQQQVMERVRENLTELDHQLASQHACTRLKIEGGWYAVIRLPATCDDEEFTVSLLNSQNVYGHPGHFYDFLSKGYVVLSLITPKRVFADGLTALLIHANR